MLMSFLRKTLLGLLMLTLALPTWTAHICGCASRPTRFQTAHAAATPVRACCARRAAAKSAPVSAQPGLKAKCCCDDIRWSRTIAKIAPQRDDRSQANSGLVSIAVEMPTIVVNDERLTECVNHSARDVGPPIPLRVMLCRWQV